MSFNYNQYFERLENKTAVYKERYKQQYKKIALKLAWWNLCFLFKKNNLYSSFTDSYQHILFDVRGGVGDLVINVKYIKAFAEKFAGNIQIDILSEENFYNINKVIFKNVPINDIITKTEKNYDLFIHLVRFPVVKQFFPQRLNSNLMQYVEHLNRFHNQNPLVATNDFFGRCYSQELGHTRENEADIDNLLDVMNHEYQLPCLPNPSEVLQKFGLAEQKYITLQTGAGFCFSEIKNEVRQWPAENYSKLAKMIKEAYPQYQIVQLGEKHQPKIEGTDIDLCGKTTFEELLVILKNAKLHISQEGGIGILRHFLNCGTSVVLFGATDEMFYGFSENINLTARRCPQACEWLCKSWMAKCMKTGTTAECMQLLTPAIVMDEIRNKGILL